MRNETTGDCRSLCDGTKSDCRGREGGGLLRVRSELAKSEAGESTLGVDDGLAAACPAPSDELEGIDHPSIKVLISARAKRERAKNAPGELLHLR